MSDARLGQNSQDSVLSSDCRLGGDESNKLEQNYGFIRMQDLSDEFEDASVYLQEKPPNQHRA
jgi:hypothetical protein